MTACRLHSAKQGVLTLNHVVAKIQPQRKSGTIGSSGTRKPGRMVRVIVEATEEFLDTLSGEIVVREGQFPERLWAVPEVAGQGSHRHVTETVTRQ